MSVNDPKQACGIRHVPRLKFEAGRHQTEPRVLRCDPRLRISEGPLNYYA